MAAGWTAIGALLLCAACSPPEPAHAPHISFAETQRDFGHVQQGTTVTHEFSFRNTGGLDLSVHAVRGGCAGTAAMLTDHTVPSAGEGRIAVSFDTSADFGRATHSVSVYSNDPAQPVSTLTLTGSIEAPIAAEPARFYVGRIHRGQSAPLDIQLITAESIAVDHIRTGGNVLTAQLRAAPRGASGPRVHVSIRPDAPFGRFSESITVQANSRQRPSLSIPVIGIVDDER